MSEKIDKNKVETIPEKEEKILAFWNENKIFEKTLSKESPKGDFVFYDGPPFATGQPHYGHLLQSIIKDAVPRYKTMRGFRVPRRWGWDCHGLPIENLIEKELGLKTKTDIETLGVDKFNKSACESVLRYADDWKKIIPRIGRFVDMDNAYKTMDSSYTESIWWVFKTLYDKGLVYLGHKSMHICPRCETTLANFEVSQGYKDITDISITAKFELQDEPKTYILAWTTTPWTLPGNVALAVGENIDYVKIKVVGGDNLILAKERLSVISEEHEVLEEFKGSELVGKSYKPLYNYYADKEDLENRSNGWKIYSANFVTTEDGVGVVHIAPAFGDDDMKLGREKKLPFVQHVGMDGCFASDVVDFVGIQVKPKDDPQSTDVLIIKDLAKRGLLYAKEKIIHSYPHCWRCDTPLLNYAASSWFVDVPAIKSDMIANNQKINWIPENVRDGRFGKWLEGASDWAISRSRYWGAPLPVWICENCGERKVVGSIEELSSSSKISGNEYFVMRHGEAVSNVEEKLSSGKNHKDNHLTEKGILQVKESAENLKNKGGVDVIVSSPYVRTAETAKIVAEVLGIKEESIVYDERLVELQVGDLDGASNDVYHDYFKDTEERFTKNAPNGENHNDTKKRMMSTLLDLESKYQGKKILIVSHGDPIWVLFAGVKGLRPNEAVLEKDEIYFDNAEIKKLDYKPLPYNENYELELHKPYIDGMVFDCSCGGKMKRIPEVFDCWFESGAMPYGQMHYPFENKELFESNFPAHFIGEALDQTRGWFYSLLVLSTALFNKPAYQNVLATGLILAEDGQKMSKRLKNYPEVFYLLDKYGADSARYYLLTSPVVRGEEIRFSEKGVDEIYKKVLMRLQNVVSFLSMYDKDKSTPTNKNTPKNEHILDKWMFARLGELTKQITEGMEKYELDRATRPIEVFIDDLSTWYLRRSRERFKSDNEEEKDNAVNNLKAILKDFSIIMAPFMPFMAEEIYQGIRLPENPESVHLENWPESNKTEKELKAEEEIISDMKDARQLVSLGLEARVKVGIRVRQPLSEIRVKSGKLKGKDEYIELIKDELNVKNVTFDESIQSEVLLDLNVTEDLKEEGRLREFVRNVQEERKKMSLNPGQKITLVISCGDIEKRFIERWKKEIEKTAGVLEVLFEKRDEMRNFEIDDFSFEISILV